MARKTRPDTSTDDTPEWTDKMFRQARKGADVLADLGIPVPPVRGRPKSDMPKQQVTLRLDADVVEHFKSGGKGWQTRINDTLAKSVSRNVRTGKPLKSGEKPSRRGEASQKSA